MSAAPKPAVSSAPLISHELELPLRRPLKIFAFDPMRGRNSLAPLTVEIANEPLTPGPRGSRVRVVDYDGVRRRYHPPVDLDDAAILMQGGLEPTEADPRFHQQMVYAVAMKVLENFDRALGRKVMFLRRRPLLLLPHAFVGPNAFFDRRLNAVCFGYFPASRDAPGDNIPGQPVFTCLSHDIIAHEVTHAIVNRLREHFLERTNPDVRAFHEGFSDIVAIFQHFTFPDVLRDAVRQSRGKLETSEALVDLAAQFGHATGRGEALRRAVYEPEKLRYETATGDYERGSVLVAAVFAGFFALYEARIQDLLRLARAGTGKLPDGDLSPDLVDRLAREASAAAQSVLTMCIRAFEYLPPVDVTYGDFLRAFVTADSELQAQDGADQRRLIIEEFRRRGIFPRGVASLAQDALRWATVRDEIEPMDARWLAEQLLVDAKRLDRRIGEPADPPVGRLLGWARRNAGRLALDPELKIEPQGFHATFRVTRAGELRVECVVQLVQKREVAGLRDIPLRGGSTIVATADGAVRFVIAKPIAQPGRLERQLAYTEALSLATSRPGGPALQLDGRNFRALHGWDA